MAGGLDPVEAFLAATGITDATIISAINTLYSDLVNYGIWGKMKAIYPFVGGTSSTHKYNLKDPQDLDASFRLVFSGGWTHSANGAQPNGTNAYANTFLNPSANQSLTSGHFSLYSRTSAASTNSFGASGVRDTPNVRSSSLIIRRSFDNTRNISMWGEGVNDLTPLTTETDGRGFYLGSRTAANSLVLYKNGTSVSFVSGNQTQTQLSTRSYFLSVLNENGSPLASTYDNKELAFGSIGDGLTNTEAADFYTAVQAFQITLGRQV